MKRFLFFLFLSIIALGIHAQAPNKKCPTCGQSMAKCQYRGKHPKPLKVVQPSKPTSGLLNGHEWVDLGLSVTWATCNVGANKPEEYGDCFAWGETKTKSSYDWDNYFDANYAIYNINNLYILPNSGNDAAREKWGSTWRMPTAKETEELGRRCKIKEVQINGLIGVNIKGPSGKSIFLPYINRIEGTNVIKTKDYWTNEVYSSRYSDGHSESYTAYHLCIVETSIFNLATEKRCYGLPIRAVTK